jgi:hypothetical protein
MCAFSPLFLVARAVEDDQTAIKAEIRRPEAFIRFWSQAADVREPVFAGPRPDQRPSHTTRPATPGGKDIMAREVGAFWPPRTGSA